MDPLTCTKDVYSGYQSKDRWAITNFWRRANTLDACIHFVNAANSRWPTDPDVQQMVNDLTTRLYTGPTTEDQFFQPWLDDDGVWADDFGWCGLASLSAYDFLLGRYDDRALPFFVGPDNPGWAKAQRYLTIAQTSWLRLVGTGYDLATEAKPVPHGCKNSTASADANANPMGTKNTVTNAGLFLLSLRLYNALKNATPQQTAAAQGYLKMAYAQYRWFSQWFTEPSPATYQYLKLVDFGSGVKGGLVNERPQPGTYNPTDNPTYEEGWVWSGDQGLVLAALAGMLQIKDELADYVQDHVDPNFNQQKFQQDVIAAIGQIATGTQKLLFGVDGIVREAPFLVSMGYDEEKGYVFSQDYAGGRGVLLRCLALPEVKKALPHGVSFDDNLKKTANAVCASLGPSPTYQVSTTLGVGQPDTAFQTHFKQLWKLGDVGVSWTFPQGPGDVDVVLQAVGLDVLGAAIPLA
jgi:hypothetical protein